MTDPQVLLSRTLDQVADLLEHVHEGNLHDPTPCQDWDVAQLIGHLTGGVRNFTEVARGRRPDWSAGPEPVTESWSATFEAAADDLRHAWHQAGDDAAIPAAMGMQLAELSVHSWDLARALGRPTAGLDQEAAARGLDFMARNLDDDTRGAAFGPAVPVPGHAPAADRIAAFAGRDPAA